MLLANAHYDQFLIAMKKRLIGGFIILLVVITVAYWFKCRLGVDIIEDLSFSRHFPFKYLVKERIMKYPEPGELIADSFEKEKGLSDWSPLWMREKNKVIKRYDRGGIRNSKCLMIHSNSDKDWSYAFSKIIEVQEGDVFELKGFVRTDEIGVIAALGVDSLDEERQTVKYGFVTRKAQNANNWVKFDTQFVIPGAVKYIRFRLYGAGFGTAWFDEIKLIKKSLPH